ncbi:hypothetical protein GGI12_001958 [Dipsacomyces acuminosporus]|nr:hypothetical protein GGI12_001958 [Dipsacomyces acuminosporus]
MLRSIASVCLLSLTVLSGAQPTNKDPGQGVPRVVGGSPAPVSKFSFVGRLEAKDRVYNGVRCTAILVSPTVALTTGHCLLTSGNSWYNPSLVTLTFGGSNTYTAQNTTINEKYNSKTLYHNIGIVTLSTPVPSSIATPVKLYTGSVGAGSQVVLAGYETTSADGASQSSQIVQTLLNLGTSSFCSRMNTYYDSPSQICADTGSGKGPCSGDAGSPLLTELSSGTLALVGIESTGTKPSGTVGSACGKPGTVDYYESTAYWASFISKYGKLSLSDFTVGGSTNSRPDSAGSSDRSPTKTASGSQGRATDDSDASSGDGGILARLSASATNNRSAKPTQATEDSNGSTSLPPVTVTAPGQLGNFGTHSVPSMATSQLLLMPALALLYMYMA